jgi:competence protein ComEA
MDDLLERGRKWLSQVGPSKKLLVFIFVAVIAVAALIGNLPGTDTPKVTSPNSAPTGSSVIHSPTFYVHVVGRVKTPGVYELEVGARLFDAVVAAGGFTGDADQASVNLARPLSDGEQIVVLKLGAIASDGGSTQVGGVGKQISLNRASETELESLPGVGPALANRIIDWRAANGGFKRKEDLLQVGGIGSKLFASLEKLVSL